MVLQEYVSFTKRKLEDAKNYRQVDSIINLYLHYRSGNPHFQFQ